MYLRYLWVLNYKNLVQQGFLFDATLAVQYEGSTGELTITRVAPQVPAGFFGPRITNVTGVLGTNGSGKSTLLELIQRLVGSFRDSDWSVFESHHEAIIILDNYVLHHDSLPVNQLHGSLSEFTLLPYRSTLRENAPRLVRPNDRYRSFYEYALITYSNHFAPSIDNGNPNVIDVSTAYLANQAIWLPQLAERPGPITFEDFEYTEFKAEINALNYLISRQLLDTIPFSVPPYIDLLVLNPDAVPSLQELTPAYLEANQAGQLNGWRQQLLADFQEALPTDAFEGFVQRLISIHLLLLLRLYPRELLQLPQVSLAALRTLETLPARLPADLADKLLDLQNFITFLREQHAARRVWLPRPAATPEDTPRNQIQLEVTSSEARQAGPQLISAFFRLIRLSEFSSMRVMRLRWVGLSTGQAAYLRLYARFYNALGQVQERNQAAPHYRVRKLLVLVDEAETGFHPQWQKQFLDILLQLLATFFEAFDVQLIVCSNSPFIASDIPKSNLILLRRTEQELGEVQPWAGREQTFAANIHSLLADSFFLHDGLLGNFAKRKLDDVLRYLLTPPAADVSGNPVIREQAQQTIQLIGEPVIRLKLEELWRERFGLEEEATYLRQRLREIEQAQQRRRD